MTEVDKRASAWRDADGDIHQTYRGAKYYCTGDEKPEPLYSAATVTALEARISDAVWRIDNEASQFINAEGMTYLKYIRDLLTGAGAK